MDDVLYNKTSSDEKLEEIFAPSNMDYKTKVKNLHNLRARIMNEDSSLQGLLTFVPSNVVPDDHPMFDSVAYTDGDEMFFGDKFFSLNKHFQMAAILHEMLHIVFRHVSRSKKRIHTLYNISADAIINSSIGFEGEQKIGNNNYAYFPKEHVVNLESLYEIYKIPTYEQKPFSSWTTESLYEFLIKKVKEDLEKQVEDQTKESKGKQGDKDSKGSNQASSDAANNTSSKNKNIDGQSDLEKLEKEIEDLQRKLAKKHKMFDGSDIKSKSNKDETTSEIDDFKWTQRFNRAKSQSLNSNKSILGRVNPDVYQPQIPWYIELRKYLVKRCMPTTEVSWQRPARRMSSIPTSKTYLPGIQNKKGLDKMVVIIDTSGSCFNEEELTMFCTEVESIQKQTNVELNLIFADTNVQSEFVVKNDGVALLDKMRKGIVKAAGGGGTDMTVPFAYALKKYRPFLTVILSDGFTPYPKSQDVKKTNLIWVVNTDVEIPKESGRTLYINPK
jgi:predicted metal-dependent peptidase